MQNKVEVILIRCTEDILCSVYIENTNRKWVGNTLISFTSHIETTTNRPPTIQTTFTYAYSRKCYVIIVIKEVSINY